MHSDISGALWLPVMWMTVSGSRFVSQWINIGSVSVQVDGSPIDVLFFLTLIIFGICVLTRRGVAIREIIRNNRWLAAFFLYSFLAIAWSDFPFIAFKRYVKILGHPVMALIILTDSDPTTALRTVMKRCGYLMMPLSALFIKYYPQYGRGFDSWSGEAVNNGIMLTKSELGAGCMVFGLFFLWNLLMARHIEDRREERIKDYLVNIGLLGITGWLMYMAHSSTSLATFVIGAATMSVLGLHCVNKRYIGTYVIVATVVAVGAQLSFDVHGKVIEFLGKDAKLTDRTDVWKDCLALVENPIFGAGFESFWLGSRLETLWAKWWWRPNQAHNGYIETYLNLGGVGVFLLAGIIISTFRKITKYLITDFDLARLRLAFLFAIVFYNYTEATFKAVGLVWTVFHIIALDYPRSSSSRKTNLVRNHPGPKKKSFVRKRKDYAVKG